MGVEKFHIATSDPGYTPDEAQFLKKVDKYRQDNHRPYVSPIDVYRMLKEEGFHAKMKYDPTDPSQIPIVRQTQRLMNVPHDDVVV